MRCTWFLTVIVLLTPSAWAETTPEQAPIAEITEASPESSTPAAPSDLATPSQAEHVDLRKVVSDPLSDSSQPKVEAEPAEEQHPNETPAEEPPIGPSAAASGAEDQAQPELNALPELLLAPTEDIETTEAATEQPTAESAAGQQPLVMLGSEVLPGTSTRLAWAAEESFAGIAAPTPVLVVHGAQPGPKLCLTAAVHGDELNGIEVVRHILYDLDPSKLRGTVIGVPIVNLQGFRRGSRYLPDRRDLNRFFPGAPEGSAASRLAYSFFQQVVRHCDLLVDLHTGSFRRTNLPQLRADLKDPGASELAHHMGAIVVLHGHGAEGTLRRSAVAAGIPAVTLEAGEPHNVQQDAVNASILSIETLLYNRNMYPQRGFWARQTQPIYYRSRWVRASTGGVLISQVKLGERVRAGALLGTITDPVTNYRDEIVSPINGRVIGMALNQVMFPGFAAYHIGYQTSVEDAAEQETGNSEEDEDALSGPPIDAPPQGRDSEGLGAPGE